MTFRNPLPVTGRDRVQPVGDRLDTDVPAINLIPATLLQGDNGAFSKTGR